MTDDQIAALVSAAEQATPGPWRVDGLQFGCAYIFGPKGEMVADDPEPDDSKCITLKGDVVVRMRGFGEQLPIEANARHIAAWSPDVALALVARLREAERIARFAVNGWACFAKRQIEMDGIADLYKQLDALSAPSPEAEKC